MISASRSSAQRRSSARRRRGQHGAGRELVRGGQQDGARVVGQLGDDDALLVHADRDRLEAAFGEEPADALVARVLDREPHRPERFGDRHERLARAGAQDHVVAARDGPAHTTPVGRDDRTQFGRPGDRGIVELGDPGRRARRR